MNQWEIMFETAHNHGLVRTDTSFFNSDIVRSQRAKQWKLSTQTCPRMSKVAHGRVLVSQNGAKSNRGQSLWSVVFSWSVSRVNRCGQLSWSVVLLGRCCQSSS